MKQGNGLDSLKGRYQPTDRRASNIHDRAPHT